MKTETRKAVVWFGVKMIFSPKFRKKYKEAYGRVFYEIVVDISPCQERRIFMMLVGFTRAGKTAVASALRKDTPVVVVSSHYIRDVINKVFPEYADDRTVAGLSCNLRRVLAARIRERIFKKLFKQGYSVISDSSNLKRKWRKKIFRRAKKRKYQTVLVHVWRLYSEIEEQAAQRAECEEWMDLLFSQYDLFDTPSLKEADYFESFCSVNDRAVAKLKKYFT